MCSVVGARLNSFNDHDIDLTDETLPAEAYVLLLSKCSTESHFAILVRRLANGRYAIRAQYRDTEVEYSPQNDKSAEFVYVNGRPMPLHGATENIANTNSTRGHDGVDEEPAAASTSAPKSTIHYYVNNEGMLVLKVHIDFMIQYDMHSIFTLQRMNVNKESLCGLCNAPLNELSSYVVDGLTSSIV